MIWHKQNLPAIGGVTHRRMVSTLLNHSIRMRATFLLTFRVAAPNQTPKSTHLFTH
jgi:hypothetical protein